METTSEENDKQKAKQDRIKKVIIGIVLVALVAFVVVDSLTNQYVKTAIDDFLEWIEDNPVIGVFAFAAVYFVATVLFIPGSILTLGSGFVFANAFGLGAGVLLGVIAVFVGAASGGIAAFLLGRYLLRDWVQKLTKKYPVFEAIDAALEDKGFRLVSLLRLSPIIPFNAFNYIMGVTAVSLSSYSLAMLFILPGTTLYVFLGASAGSLSQSGSSGDDPTVTIIVVVCGVVFGVAAIAATSYYAKKELKKVTERRKAEGENELIDDPKEQLSEEENDVVDVEAA